MQTSQKSEDAFSCYVEARVEAEKIFLPIILAVFVAGAWYTLLAPFIHDIPSIVELVTDAFAEKPVFGILTTIQAKVLTVQMAVVQFGFAFVLPLLVAWALHRRSATKRPLQ